MPIYLIRWDCGYGEEMLICHEKDQKAANERAHQEWQDNANQDYSANEIDRIGATDLDLEMEYDEEVDLFG